MTRALSILHLEDSDRDAELAANHLAADGLECGITRVGDRDRFLAALDRGGFDLVLADYAGGSIDGLTALALARERAPELPVILLSGTEGEELAVEALQLGAADYLLKDRLARLGSAVRRALAEADRRREQSRAERELRRSEVKYRGLFENLLEGVFQWGAEGRVESANPALVELLGYRSEGELRERTAMELFVASEDGDELFERLGKGGRVRDFESELRRSDGSAVPVMISARVVTENGTGGRYEGTISDMTERQRYREQLTYLASHDALTGLFNRRRFEEELERQLANARRSRTPGAVLWFDLDRFKDINDSLGHAAGDQVLVEFAGTLRRGLRTTDVLARFGGDEFAVVLPGVGREDALALAKRLATTLRSERMVIDGAEVRLTASIGLALYPEPCDSAEELMAQADLALHRAKQSRDSVSVSEVGEDWRTQLQERVDWGRRLREALETEDRLLFHAQPILDLRRRKVERYELLLRMRDEDGGVVLPGVFLPAAQRFGMMREVDHWVERHAIRLAAGLNGSSVVLHVNLSAQSVSDPEMADRIAGDLAASGVDPERLVWEITETAAIADLHRASVFARRLRELGCRLALDDFGIGFASYAHLKHLPFDLLKIDGSFIRGLAHDPVDRHLVEALAELGRGLHKQTVAEYVEDAETLELVAGYKIDFGQGFHIGRPMPFAPAALGGGLAGADPASGSPAGG